MSSNRGFTLVELVIVMAIFMGIMIITSYSFENILKKSGQQMKSAETQTEGMVGLEMLRSDLEHAGMGLPWAYSQTLASAFPEVTSSTPVSGLDIAPLNEITPSAVLVLHAPTSRKILGGGANDSNPDSAYLTIKSMRVPLNDTVKKWAYMNYSGSGKSYVKKWETNDDFGSQSGSTETVVTISSTFTTSGTPNRVLMMPSASQFFYKITNPATAPVVPPSTAYQPGDASQLYIVYGVDPGRDLSMPYNRADYYIRRPASSDPVFKVPTSCNQGTGILFKAVAQHNGSSGGTFANAEYPLLNCAADMQVEFELDYNNDGNITYSPVLQKPDPVTHVMTAMTPADIRSNLKNIRVYILAHEGKKDTSYSYPSASIQVGDPARASSGRTWDGSATCGTGPNCMQNKFGADWKNYRWKVYTISVGPKNLQ